MQSIRKACRDWFLGDTASAGLRLNRVLEGSSVIVERLNAK